MPDPPDVSEAELSVPAAADDPRLDHPWAVWDTFRGILTCLFRRGLPPTLDHPRIAVKFLRTMTLMLALGVISTGACAGWMGIEQLIDASGVSWSFKGFGLMILPGAWFGLFVLVPLSRWQGRNWCLTIPAVPISTGIYWCAVVSYIEGAPIMSRSPGDAKLAGIAAGCVGGLGLSVWMNPPWRWSALKATGITVLAAVFGSLCFALMFDHDPGMGILPDPINRLFGTAALFGPFHGSVAMALGLRLLWDPPAR